MVSVALMLFGPRLALWGLVVLTMALAIPVFLVSSVVLVLIDGLFHPKGALAGALGLAWLIASLATLFVILVRAHRILNVILEAPRRVAGTLDPSMAADLRPSPRTDRPDASTLAPRLGAADARLATPAPRSEPEAVDRTE